MSRKRTGRVSVFLLAPLLLALLVACDSDPQLSGEIRGQALYRERIALPADAELQIELQDISRPDAPGSTLAVVLIPADRGPPYDFVIRYRPADLDPQGHYALRASIRGAGRALFASTDYVDPFASPGPEILLHRVPR